MTRDELIRTQRREIKREIYALAMLCRRRFLRSADLVGVRGAAIDRLRQVGLQDAVDLTPLFPAWQLLCDRYMAELYDPQLVLFADPETEALTAWLQFVYQKLFATLVREDEFVRNVLRALGSIPCQSPDQAAAAAVCQYLLEMPLPSKPPPWAHEETVE
jgi:hypothetical protein